MKGKKSSSTSKLANQIEQNSCDKSVNVDGSLIKEKGNGPVKSDIKKSETDTVLVHTPHIHANEDDLYLKTTSINSQEADIEDIVNKASTRVKSPSTSHSNNKVSKQSSNETVINWQMSSSDHRDVDYGMVWLCSVVMSLA
jgi:hypothetical protein